MIAKAEQDRAAVIYCRVSTADQADNGVSLDAQRERARAWCKANGYRVAAEHVDAGLSGRRADNRPALQAALADVAEPGRVLVVYSLSRVARSTKDTLAIADVLDKAGADLVSLSESIDTTSAAGKMVFRLLAVLSEFESDLVSERTRAAMSHKKARSQRVSGRLPFGYDLADDGTSLLPNAAEQATLADIRDKRQHGWTLKAIADDLQARQIRTKLGRDRWSVSTLHALVRG